MHVSATRNARRKGAPRLMAPLAVLTIFLHPGCTPLDSIEEATALFRSGHRTTGKSYTGKMSWYSVRTNGGTRTASGETFSNSGATAAHRTLPMGTKVRVTNLANDKSAVVRINDRGPFIPGRIIDVSIGTAKKLGFVQRGVVRCRIDVLGGTGTQR